VLIQPRGLSGARSARLRPGTHEPSHIRFGLLQDGNVGVFPECDEILIRGACFGGVALHRVGMAEAGERADTIN
jgi:hypothetical protein